MIAKPRTRREWWYPTPAEFGAGVHARETGKDDEAVLMPCRPEDGLMLECDIVQPPSSVGRTVLVWIEPHAIDAVLRALRQTAIEMRR